MTDKDLSLIPVIYETKLWSFGKLLEIISPSTNIYLDMANSKINDQENDVQITTKFGASQIFITLQKTSPKITIQTF
jgi:hypothetical protein